MTFYPPIWQGKLLFPKHLPLLSSCSDPQKPPKCITLHLAQVCIKFGYFSLANLPRVCLVIRPAKRTPTEKRLFLSHSVYPITEVLGETDSLRKLVPTFHWLERPQRQPWQWLSSVSHSSLGVHSAHPSATDVRPPALSVVRTFLVFLPNDPDFYFSARPSLPVFRSFTGRESQLQEHCVPRDAAFSCGHLHRANRFACERSGQQGLNMCCVWNRFALLKSGLGLSLDLIQTDH